MISFSKLILRYVSTVTSNSAKCMSLKGSVLEGGNFYSVLADSRRINPLMSFPTPRFWFWFWFFKSCVSSSTLKISLSVVQNWINFKCAIGRHSIISKKNTEHICFTKMNILTQTVFFISDRQPGV